MLGRGKARWPCSMAGSRVHGRPAGKLGVERLEGDARSLRNLANFRVVVASVGENGLGCLEDELAVEFLFRPSGYSFCPRDRHWLTLVLRQLNQNELTIMLF